MTYDHPSPREQPKRARIRRATLVKLIVMAAAVAGFFLVASMVDLPDPDAIRDRVSAAGVWGLALFVLFYALVSATPFPASTLTVAAGLLFGLPVGVAVVIVAATIGAYIGYWAARALGRGPVSRAEWSKLRKLDALLGRRGLVSVVIVRVIPFPFALVNYAAGVSAIGQRDYLVGTALGIVPATVGFTALGAYGTSPLSWPFAIAVIAVLVVIAGSSLLARRFGVTREEAASDTDTSDTDSENADHR